MQAPCGENTPLNAIFFDIGRNGQFAGEGKLKRTLFRHGLESFDIGRDTDTAVDPVYKNKDEFPFTGKIDQVTFKIIQQ